MNTQTRPAFSTAGLPAFAQARMAAKAAASWCYVTADDRPFYVSEAQAKAMQAAHGGTVFAPEA